MTEGSGGARDGADSRFRSIGDVDSHWWWALASASQLTWGVSWFRQGCQSRLMPLKAFGTASLFIGAGASAAMSTLHACGVRTRKDILEAGANIRAGFRVHPPLNTSPDQDTLRHCAAWSCIPIEMAAFFNLLSMKHSLFLEPRKLISMM